jgi:hypothetical protein
MSYEFEALSGKIIEAAISVHRELGPGFLESVYESAMTVALRHRGIVYQPQGISLFRVFAIRSLPADTIAKVRKYENAKCVSIARHQANRPLGPRGRLIRVALISEFRSFAFS